MDQICLGSSSLSPVTPLGLHSTQYTVHTTPSLVSVPLNFPPFQPCVNVQASYPAFSINGLNYNHNSLSYAGILPRMYSPANEQKEPSGSEQRINHLPRPGLAREFAEVPRLPV